MYTDPYKNPDVTEQKRTNPCKGPEITAEEKNTYMEKYKEGGKPRISILINQNIFDYKDWSERSKEENCKHCCAMRVEYLIKKFQMKGFDDELKKIQKEIQPEKLLPGQTSLNRLAFNDAIMFMKQGYPQTATSQFIDRTNMYFCDKEGLTILCHVRQKKEFVAAAEGVGFASDCLSTLLANKKAAIKMKEMLVDIIPVKWFYSACCDFIHQYYYRSTLSTTNNIESQKSLQAEYDQIKTLLNLFKKEDNLFDPYNPLLNKIETEIFLPNWHNPQERILNEKKLNCLWFGFLAAAKGDCELLEKLNKLGWNFALEYFCETNRFSKRQIKYVELGHLICWAKNIETLAVLLKYGAPYDKKITSIDNQYTGYQLIIHNENLDINYRQKAKQLFFNFEFKKNWKDINFSVLADCTPFLPIACSQLFLLKALSDTLNENKDDIFKQKSTSAYQQRYVNTQTAISTNIYHLYNSKSLTTELVLEAEVKTCAKLLALQSNNGNPLQPMSQQTIYDKLVSEYTTKINQFTHMDPTNIKFNREIKNYLSLLQKYTTHDLASRIIS